MLDDWKACRCSLRKRITSSQKVTTFRGVNKCMLAGVLEEGGDVLVSL